MTDIRERLKVVSLVIVGASNGNMWFSENLGTLTLREEGGSFAPFLMHGERGLDNPHKLEFCSKAKGEYVFEIPDWLGAHGLRIHLSTSAHQYRYTTGLHPYDSGGSGPLAFGGCEMVEIFDALFYP